MSGSRPASRIFTAVELTSLPGVLSASVDVPAHDSAAQMPRLQPEVQHALAFARQWLQGTYGKRLRHLILYGSQARGEAHAESDVDLLLVLQGPVDVAAELKRLTVLKLELLERFGRYVSLQPVDEPTFQDSSHPFLRNVHREGISLL